ncbi:MAG: Uma2 family endonuclease [Acidobacteria bacterium]|nr:Uma2 family endonuclease [Acidobacteriota bacterium]
MSAVATEVTIADLERFPDDGMHREILDGGLIELPPPKSGHSKTAGRIHRSLDRFVEQKKLGTVYLEAGYQIFQDDRNWLQPDVSF